MNLNSEEAYKFVKEKRTNISPNFNFLGQLYEYEMEQEQIKNYRTDELNDQLKSNNLIIKSSHIKDETNLLEQKTVICKDSDLSILNFKNKKKIIFNFNNSSAVTSLNNCSPSTPISPSQAFSNFNLNSPTNNQVSKIFLKESLPSDSFNTDIEKISKNDDYFVDLSSKNYDSKINNEKSIFNVSLKKNIDLKSKSINSLKRPSSILLNQKINHNYNESFSSVDKIKSISKSKEIDIKEVKPEIKFSSLSRTFSNTSSSSASSSCSFASISSTFSNTLTNSSNSNLNDDIQQKNNFNQQTLLLNKKIKYSPKHEISNTELNINENFSL